MGNKKASPAQATLTHLASLLIQKWFKGNQPLQHVLDLLYSFPSWHIWLLLWQKHLYFPCFHQFEQQLEEEVVMEVQTLSLSPPRSDSSLLSEFGFHCRKRMSGGKSKSRFVCLPMFMKPGQMGLIPTNSITSAIAPGNSNDGVYSLLPFGATKVSPRISTSATMFLASFSMTSTTTTSTTSVAICLLILLLILHNFSGFFGEGHLWDWWPSWPQLQQQVVTL